MAVFVIVCKIDVIVGRKERRQYPEKRIHLVGDSTNQTITIRICRPGRFKSPDAEVVALLLSMSTFSLLHERAYWYGLPAVSSSRCLPIFSATLMVVGSKPLSAVTCDPRSLVSLVFLLADGP